MRDTGPGSRAVRNHIRGKRVYAMIIIFYCKCNINSKYNCCRVSYIIIVFENMDGTNPNPHPNLYEIYR